MPRGLNRLVVAAAALALVAACGTDGDDLTGAPTISEASQEPASEAANTDPPAFPGDTARQAAEHAGGWDLVLTDVRVAEHQSFDRIVLEFTGTGIPGWVVSFVDAAALDGSGEAVRLAGDAILDIYASGTTWPGSGYYRGPRRIEPEGGGNVHEVYVGGTFEGYTQVLAGVAGDPAPFRVFPLTDPARLVVDVEAGSSD